MYSQVSVSYHSFITITLSYHSKVTPSGILCTEKKSWNSCALCTKNSISNVPLTVPRPVGVYKCTVDGTYNADSGVATWKQTFQDDDTSSAGHYTMEHFPACMHAAGAVFFQGVVLEWIFLWGVGILTGEQYCRISGIHLWIPLHSHTFKQ